MRNLPTAVMQKWAFYASVILGVTVLFSFQNCGKVKFNSSRSEALVVPQSCGSITMVPQNGLYQDEDVSFKVTAPDEITISNLTWNFTKGATTVFTSTANPVVHKFNGAGEGSGDYVATATYMKSDGNGCELTQSFQILLGDLCADPSGISGPTIGFAGEETSPFSVNAEACFQGTVVWDMDNDGIPEYNVGVNDSITHIYIAPGTYTVKATVINADDNSQTILTHEITINYANCTNGANNPPNCDQCIPGQVLVDNQCVANCTNGAINPPTCVNCPAGKTLVSGQCIDNCTNGATNPPTCTTCPSGKSLVNGQCIANCTNGATNPPTCTTCPSGKTLVGGQCVNNCTNGATNPPTCTTCPSGKTLVGGQCVNNCTNGATNPPTCTTCPSGKTLVSDQCVPATCSLPWGGTINQGQNVTAYQNSSVAYGSTCKSETRACSAGVLSGSYTNKTCTVNPGASCAFNGSTVAHGQSVTAYSTSSVDYGKTCTSQVRTCTNGSLSGSYAYASCSAKAPASCTLPWGGTIAHGNSVTAYAASTTACGGTCSSQTRTCNNGSLSGSNTAKSCTVPDCGTCAANQVIACFVAGTKVTLADGKTKNIEDIGEGESVRTFDESTGQITVSPVEEVFHHEESLSELYTFEYSDGKKVTSNDIHLFYSVNVKNYLPAKEIYSRWMRGQEMLLMTDNHKVVTVKNITRKVETVKLYNIHVTSAYDGKAPSRIGHNYFVNGILVHNEKAWMTVCDGLGLEVNDKNNGCLPSNFGPFSGHNVECCEKNGGKVDLDPSYPRRGFCYGINNCNGFNACMGKNSDSGPANWNCRDGFTTSCGQVLVDDAHINKNNPGYAIINTSPNPTNGAPNQHCGCSKGTRVKVGAADCSQLIQYYRCEDYSGAGCLTCDTQCVGHGGGVPSGGGCRCNDGQTQVCK